MKKGLSAERHIEIAANIKKNLHDLMELDIEIARAYGKSASVSKSASKAYLQVSRLREALDVSAFRDVSDPDFNSPYYGCKPDKTSRP